MKVFTISIVLGGILPFVIAKPAVIAFEPASYPDAPAESLTSSYSTSPSASPPWIAGTNTLTSTITCTDTVMVWNNTVTVTYFSTLISTEVCTITQTCTVTTTEEVTTTETVQTCTIGPIGPIPPPVLSTECADTPLSEFPQASAG